MPVSYKKNLVQLSGAVSVEEAEGLLEWLLRKPSAKVDLSGCTHLHPANLQVLMASRCAVNALPADQALAAWVASALRLNVC
jgi:hypothetical protein